MPRPLRDLDPGQGPVQALAGELRALRTAAGDPKFDAMSRRSGRSRTALSEAVGGRHLPRWETVVGFVEACGARPEDWRGRWEQAREEAATTAGAAEPAPPEPAIPPAPPVAAPTRRRRRAVTGGLLVLAALLGAAAALGAVALLGAPAGSPVPVVVVQNKVAVGPDALLEDATPAYLSTAAVPYCRSRGCGVPGTDMASGAVLAVDCTVLAEDMVNYEADSVVSRDNPHRARSTLWYRARFPDGRTGFLSEVYVDTRSRGGLGLPDCAG